VRLGPTHARPIDAEKHAEKKGNPKEEDWKRMARPGHIKEHTDYRATYEFLGLVDGMVTIQCRFVQTQPPGGTQIELCRITITPSVNRYRYRTSGPSDAIWSPGRGRDCDMLQRTQSRPIRCVGLAQQGDQHISAVVLCAVFCNCASMNI
jgi:hypothetical protein